MYKPPEKVAKNKLILVLILKSGCEKSWAEVQVDSLTVACRGYAKM